MTQPFTQIATQPSTQATNTNTLTPAMQQQLEQLRDIHLPEPVSWFPMAIGWWLLIALIILAVIWGYRKMQAYRRIYKHPVYLSALEELSQIKANANHDKANQNAQLAGDLSALLKRVGIYLSLPVASLTGDAWAEYLTQSENGDACFNQAQANFIAHGAYMDYSKAHHQVPDWKPLEASARNWITEKFKQSGMPKSVKNQRNTRWRKGKVGL